MISKTTAMDIALAYREIETGEVLLADITKAVAERKVPDIRDAFGRPRGALQLGVPSGDDSRRMFEVPWSLAKPVIEATIADARARLGALMVKAEAELSMPIHPGGPHAD